MIQFWMGEMLVSGARWARRYLIYIVGYEAWQDKQASLRKWIRREAAIACRVFLGTAVRFWMFFLFGTIIWFSWVSLNRWALRQSFIADLYNFYWCSDLFEMIDIPMNLSTMTSIVTWATSCFLAALIIAMMINRKERMKARMRVKHSNLSYSLARDIAIISAMADSTENLVVIVDKRLNVTYVNKSYDHYSQQYGWKNYMGKRLDSVIPFFISHQNILLKKFRSAPENSAEVIDTILGGSLVKIEYRILPVGNGSVTHLVLCIFLKRLERQI